MRLAALLALATAAGACKLPEQREKALVQLRARAPAERARAVRAVAAEAKDDVESWTAISHAARDQAREVRLAVAAALGAAPKAGQMPSQDEGGPPEADDVLGGLLSDPLNEVRAAAAASLGQRCGPRAKGYLISAFARSFTPARAAIVAALGKCGTPPGEALSYEEARRRDKAMKMLEVASSAQRAQAVLALGLLGREQDVKAIAPLLDDADGVVAAAAARALGAAGASSAEPKLRALLSDDATLLAAAAAEALAALGPAAVSNSAAALKKVAARPDEAADAAALALTSASLDSKELCAAAAGAQRVGAARALALAGRCAPGELLQHVALADAARAAAALAAALAVEPGPAPESARPLSSLIEKAPPAVAAQAARIAQRLRVTAAGPALLIVVKRERKWLEASRKPRVPTDRQEMLAEIDAQRSSRTAKPMDRKKYEALMARLKARGMKEESRAGAAARLSDLLRADEPAARRELLAAALRAALALSIPGVAAAAKALAGDPEPVVRSAALGEPEAAPAAEPNPLDCLPPDGARVEAPPAGCLQRVAALPEASLAGDAGLRARAAARAALYSDEGGERAAACSLLHRLDPAAAAIAAPLADDPERRVRAACASTAAVFKTAPPKER